MLNRLVARSLMAIVPDKVPVTIVLSPDSPTPETIDINSAWLKPLSVTLSEYGNVNLQGDETRIMIPQHLLNPVNENREIRARDRISAKGISYRVVVANLKTARTVWECIVRKELA